MENNGNGKPSGDGQGPKRSSYGDMLSTVAGETPAERAERLKHAEPAPDEQGRSPGAASPEDKDQAASAKRRRIIAIVLAALLGAAALVSVVLNPGNLFGDTGASVESPTKAPKSDGYAPKKGSTDAALYLYAQNWDTKKHNSLKSLKKVNNLRYALDFFQSYTPEQIAAVPSMPCALTDVAANYDKLAGNMVSFKVQVEQKETVSEDLGLESNQPSSLLTLPGDASYGGASLIVLGSGMDGVSAGDTVECRCVPIYYYDPKDTSGTGGLLFITIPQLVYKAK